MAPKDSLARGARSATYGVSGHASDPIELKNVASEEPTEITPIVPLAPAPIKRKVFTPLGTQILVRRAENEITSYTDMKTAQEAATPGVVLIENAVEQDHPAEGTILATGDDVYTVGVGDYIAFGKYSGAELRKELAKQLGGGTLLLMREEEVLGIIADAREYLKPAPIEIDWDAFKKA
jgi:co-chaperonin GroES (HSP10)